MLRELIHLRLFMDQHAIYYTTGGFQLHTLCGQYLPIVAASFGVAFRMIVFNISGAR